LAALNRLECLPAVLAFAAFSVRHAVPLRNALDTSLRHTACRPLPARRGRLLCPQSLDRRGSIWGVIC
jgi:hypothetical protein